MPRAFPILLLLLSSQFFWWYPRSPKRPAVQPQPLFCLLPCPTTTQLLSPKDSAFMISHCSFFIFNNHCHDSLFKLVIGITWETENTHTHTTTDPNSDQLKQKISGWRCIIIFKKIPMFLQDWESLNDIMISVSSHPVSLTSVFYHYNQYCTLPVIPSLPFLFFEVFLFFNASMIKALFYSKQNHKQISKL